MTRERVRYVGLGVWPYFVGFTLSEEAFDREMRRLKIRDPGPWILEGGHDACAHHFEKNGQRLSIICVPRPSRRCTREQYAAMVAHEALHVVQRIRAALGELGEEAEAYTLQTIVQDVLQVAWSTGRLIRLEPIPF